MIPLTKAKPGDVLVFRGGGILYEVLSRLIKRFKEPNYDRFGWHMSPIIKVQHSPYFLVTYIDAQFPRLKLAIVKPDDQVRCYRVLKRPPTKAKVQVVIDRLVGRPYDFLVHIWTFFAFLLRPKVDVPRIINRFYDCWEATFEALDEWGVDVTHVYHYPWLTDFLHFVGEIKDV